MAGKRTLTSGISLSVLLEITGPQSRKVNVVGYVGKLKVDWSIVYYYT